MKKRILIAASGLAIAGSTLGIANAAFASSTMPSAAKHQNHVRPSYRRERIAIRLNQAVRDGTITTAQKTAFLKELNTLRAEHKADISKTSTKAQRQAERTKLQGELQAWATANDFPLGKILPRAS